MAKLLSLICLLIVNFGCSKKNDNQLRVAATPVPQAQILKQVEPELKAQGIDLKIIEVDDYQVPNRALAEKEVDANFFQHMPFLEEQKKDFHYSIVCFAKIHLEPMGIYSKKIQNLDQLKANDIAAIPNDPTNEYRALMLLENAHLIEVAENSGKTTVANITQNSIPLRFKEIDAALLPRVLDDVTIAAIPTNFALQANLNPKNALALEGTNSPYTNILAIREGDENNPKLIALKKALLSDKVKEYIETTYKGTIIPVLSDCQE